MVQETLHKHFYYHLGDFKLPSVRDMTDDTNPYSKLLTQTDLDFFQSNPSGDSDTEMRDDPEVAGILA